MNSTLSEKSKNTLIELAPSGYFPTKSKPLLRARGRKNPISEKKRSQGFVPVLSGLRPGNTNGNGL